MSDLLASLSPPDGETLTEGVVLFRARAGCAALLPLVLAIAARAPFRHMTTPGGHVMTVAMTNCGERGWVSDRRGYHYRPFDPESGRPWPAMPPVLRALATDAAARAGFEGFAPDACLINRYAVGSRLTAHQDRDEQDLGAPVVSLSLGLPAIFLWHGARRGGKPLRVPLDDGDVLVFGGPARLGFHGVKDIAPGTHPAAGPFRYNLTFRRTGLSAPTEGRDAIKRRS